MDAFHRLHLRKHEWSVCACYDWAQTSASLELSPDIGGRKISKDWSRLAGPPATRNESPPPAEPMLWAIPEFIGLLMRPMGWRAAGRSDTRDAKSSSDASVYGTNGRRASRACPLCPDTSDINLFRYCQGVIRP